MGLRLQRAGVAAPAWGLCGVGIGAALGAWTVLANPSIVTVRDALVVIGLVALAYALLFAVAGALASVVLGLLRRMRRRNRIAFGFHAQVALALLTYAAFCVGNLLATRSTSWTLEVDQRAVAGGASSALVVGLLVAFLVSRTGQRSWLRRPALVTWACLGLVVLAPFSIFLRAKQPPDSLADTAGLAPPREPHRVLLVGVDGADWGRLRKLMEDGRMPVMRELCERGTTAALTTLRPTWSPCIWTTIATGQAPERHGILDFTSVELPGCERGVQRLRVLQRTALNPLPAGPALPPYTGLAPLVYALVDAGILREHPVGAFDRRTKAVWNIASDLGLEVAVVGWWATWPAEQVNGALVSGEHARRATRVLREQAETARELAGFTHPPGLLGELAELQDAPNAREIQWDEHDVQGSSSAALALPLFQDLDDLQRATLREDPGALRLALNMWAEDGFQVATAEHLMQRIEPALACVYLQGVDAVSHRIEAHARRDPGYVAIVDRYYEHVDELVGRLVAAAGPEASVVIVSDHGWSYGSPYGHYHAPDGVFVLAGAGAQPGELLAPVHVRDVAPTVLALLGLPASREMPGSVITSALAPSLGATLPAGRIRSYGPYRPVWSAGKLASAAASQDSLDRLRELGYVQ